MFSIRIFWTTSNPLRKTHAAHPLPFYIITASPSRTCVINGTHIKGFPGYAVDTRWHRKRKWRILTNGRTRMSCVKLKGLGSDYFANIKHNIITTIFRLWKQRTMCHGKPSMCIHGRRGFRIY